MRVGSYAFRLFNRDFSVEIRMLDGAENQVFVKQKLAGKQLLHLFLFRVHDVIAYESNGCFVLLVS